MINTTVPVAKFVNFKLQNLECLNGCKDGDILGYTINDGNAEFSALSGALGKAAQDALKTYNKLWYGTVYDVDSVSKEITLYFDDLSYVINELPPYLEQMEQEKNTGELNKACESELNQVKERLQLLLTTTKTATLGLLGVFETALSGKTDDNYNPGFFYGPFHNLTGKKIKNKCGIALTYSRLSSVCEQYKDPIIDMLMRVSRLLNQEFKLVEESDELAGYGLVNTLSNGLHMIGSTVTQIGNTVTSLFIDGNHLSKQHKWHLFMSLTAQNLEKAMGKNINVMLSELSNSDDIVDSDVKKFVLLTVKLLNILQDGAKEFTIGEDERTRYRELVKLFRELAECPGYEKIKNDDYEIGKHYSTEIPLLAFRILRTLNFVRFAENNINEFSEYMLCRLGVEKYSDDDIKIAVNVTEGFKKFPELMANRAAKNVAMSDAPLGKLDLYAKSNSPHMLGTFDIYSPSKNEMKPVTLIRMGTPTIDCGITSGFTTNKAILNPEYKLFLEDCKDKEKKVLYFSLQNQHTTLKPEQNWESIRNAALIKGMEDFSGTFHVVVLDNDYNRFLTDEINIMEFEKNLLERMKMNLNNKNDNGGYYFPELKISPQSYSMRPSLSQLLDETVQATREIMFDKNPTKTLTRQQQADFIELSHALLGLILPSFVDADYVNVTCKDDIDRGMKMTSLLLEILAIAQKHDQNIDVRWLIRTITHSPAVLIKAQAMNNHVNKLNSARNYLKIDEVKDRIRDPNIFSFFKIINNSDISGLPIDYNGKFGFLNPVDQRPNEKVLNKFANILKEADKNDGNILHNFFNAEHLKDMVNKYINSDFFVESSNCDLLQDALENKGLMKQLVQIAKKELPIDVRQKLSDVVAEMLFFTFLHPESLDHVKSKQFSDSMLSVQLKEIINEPLEFLGRIDALGSYYDEPRSIPQKMFRHCLLSIQDVELRNKIRSDELFTAIDKSANITEFMSIVAEVPQHVNAEIFGGITSINNALEMLIMGESAVKLMETKGVDKGPLDDAASLLKQMRELMTSIAKNEYTSKQELLSQVKLLRRFIPIWNMAMMNLKKMD